MLYLIKYPLVLEYRIPLHAVDALDSPDDHLNRRRIPPLQGIGNDRTATKSIL